MEYGDSTPTLRVSGIGVELSVLTPAAIGLGISVERGNGGLDSVVKSCENYFGVYVSVSMCGNSRSTGCGGIWRSYGGKV